MTPNALLAAPSKMKIKVNVNDGSFTPMLATNYSWNSDNTQVTFTIRQGVKWNDGKPFSANDVAFTFRTITGNPQRELMLLSLTELLLDGR